VVGDSISENKYHKMNFINEVPMAALEREETKSIAGILW
jgi:hypothetical protein